MNLSLLNTLFERLACDGVKRISFIGGEPFIHDYFMDAVRLAKKAGFLLSTVTNGSLLNNDIIDEIVANDLFESIIFSLDGYGRNHDVIRGKDIYERVERNILYLNSAKRRLKRKLPSVLFYFTVSSYNFSYIEKDIPKLLKLNPSKIRIQLASYLSPEVVEQTNRILSEDIISSHSYSVDVGIDDKVISETKKAVENLRKKHGGRIVAEKILTGANTTCEFIFKSAVITPSGNILPCPMATGFVIGNIYETSLKEAFEKNYERILKLKEHSKKGLPLCKQCCVEKVII